MIWLLGGNDAALTAKFKAYPSECFRMKDIGTLKYLLGIEVSRGKDDIYLSQRKYALDIISETGLLGSKPVDTPMEQNHGLAQAKGYFFSRPQKVQASCGQTGLLSDYSTGAELCCSHFGSVSVETSHSSLGRGFENSMLS